MMIEAELRHWARSCLSKKYYLTQAVAEQAAKRRRRCGAPKLRSYYCRFCGGHHLTKQPREEALMA